MKETRHGYDVWTIVSPDGGTRASFIPSKGGTGCSIVMPTKAGPRELLFLHDYFWDEQTAKIPGGWPFLFPVCAQLAGGEAGRYLYDGRLYSLPSHGFGPRKAWTVMDDGRADTLVMQLRDDEETRAAYPFRFEITLAYRVEPGALLCEQTYHNIGAAPMPYYAGFHPYFLTPPPGAGKEGVRLDYRPMRSFRYNERLTDLAGETPPPAMPVAVTEPGINERLTRVGADREARLHFPGGPTLHMTAEGVEDLDLFPYIQLYTMTDKPFFCVEPWMSFPNALNTVSGCRWLAPGASEHGLLRLWTGG